VFLGICAACWSRAQGARDSSALGTVGSGVRRTTENVQKTLVITLIVGLSAVFLWLLWPRSRTVTQPAANYTSTIQLSGTPGAAFTGEYVRDGQRIRVSGVMPWSVTESNIARLEILKARPEDTLRVEAHGGGQMVSAPAGPGAKGIRVQMAGGWSFEIIR
jgi:hypothetical protein